MKKAQEYFLAVAAAGFLACCNLTASTTPLTGIATLPDLPGDTISIVLAPSDGAVDGVAGSTVGWGFTVTWTSTEGDWMTFLNPSTVGGETQPTLLASYTDFIAAQGGPDDYAISTAPADTPWSESFDPSNSLGVGAYQIASDAATGALDEGEIIFSFQVYTGDPGNGGAQIGTGTDDEGNYLYTVPFSVNVDAPPLTSTPELGTYWLFPAGMVGLVSLKLKRTARSDDPMKAVMPWRWPS